MKYLIKFLAIIGLVSMSHVAVAEIPNVADRDILTADMVNEVVNDVNDNSAAVEQATEFIADDKLGDFDIVIGACVGAPAGAPFKVGDPGPSGAGGLVFYVTADGCNGLEAAPDDQSDGAQWGCLTDQVGASRRGIGDGAPNTLKIMDAGCAGVADAAPLTRAYAGGAPGDDWYLPSADELVLMCNTIGLGEPDGEPADNAGGFQSDAYWSSTEEDNNAALGVIFDFRCGVVNDPQNGFDATPKTFLYNVRAIRTIN